MFDIWDKPDVSTASALSSPGVDLAVQTLGRIWRRAKGTWESEHPHQRILEKSLVRLLSRLPTTVHWNRRALRPSPVAKKTALAWSARDGNRLRVQLFRFHRRCRTSAQGGRSRRQKEDAEVKAYTLERLCRCAEPARVARPDVLVQYEKGREAILGG